MASTQPYETSNVPNPQGGTSQAIAVMKNGALVAPLSGIMDDVAQSTTQVIARVKSTAPDGTEPALLVREAQAGVQGTGLNPPTGGSGLLGFLSGIYAQLVLLVTNGISSSPAISGTATPHVTACSGTSVTLLASNALRKGCRIFNDTAVGFGNGAGHGAYLYILWGTGTASPANCSEIVAPGQAVGIPANYTGAVQGIWAGADIGGNALATEFT